jgi:hypothetical protein
MSGAFRSRDQRTISPRARDTWRGEQGLFAYIARQSPSDHHPSGRRESIKGTYRALGCCLNAELICIQNSEPDETNDRVRGMILDSEEPRSSYNQLKQKMPKLDHFYSESIKSDAMAVLSANSVVVYRPSESQTAVPFYSLLTSSPRRNSQTCQLLDSVSLSCEHSGSDHTSLRPITCHSRTSELPIMVRSRSSEILISPIRRHEFCTFTNRSKRNLSAPP